MNLILVFLVIYMILFGINEALSNFILNSTEDKISKYFDDEKITLNQRNELIIKALINEFMCEISTARWQDFIPIIGIYLNLQNIYYQDDDIADFISFITEYYSDILYQEIEPIKEENVQDEPSKYFLSYELNNRIITFWFTYNNGQFEILDACETFKKLSKKEQYQILYQILKQLSEGNKKDYHYSDNIEEVLMPEMIKQIQEIEEKDLIRTRLLNK